MCYTRDHRSSDLKYVCPYHILNVHVHQLFITYQHGVTFYFEKRGDYILVCGIHFIHRYNFYFPQLLHLVDIFSTVFWASSPGQYKQRRLNIEKVFNNYGKSCLSLSILSAVNSIISIKDNQFIFSFMLVGQYSVLSLRSGQLFFDGS